MQPTVGRIVHYYGRSARYDGQPVAAIITEVNPGLSDDQWYELSALEDGLADQSMIVRLDIRWPEYEEPIDAANVGHLYPFSEAPKPGHWTWPPRA